MASRSLNVLLVDDDAVTCLALSSLLRADGIEVEVLHDAARALARLGERNFDALLTDMSLPSMNGRELVRAARARSPNLPCFVLSGADVSDPEEAARELGARLWLVKPVEYETLLQELASLQGAA